MRPCPRCAASNRAEARFCRQCSYVFAPPVTLPPPAVAPSDLSSRRKWPLILAIAGAAALITLMISGAGLLLARPTRLAPTAGPVPFVLTPTSPTPAITPVTIGGLASPAPLPATPTAPLTAAQALNRALHSVVQIIVPVEGDAPSSTGSGTLLTAQGHILTNFHVLGNPETGQLFNRQGNILIAVSPANLSEPPEIKYVAELVQSDRERDLALLKVVSRLNGEPLPLDLGLTPIPVGNSETVTIGDELTIIGFPGLGGDTVTLTRGSVAGFLPQEGWLKTDAEINPGNSGGAAINQAGELIGIPTQVTLDQGDLPGKIGLARPVNLARPLIDLALADSVGNRP